MENFELMYKKISNLDDIKKILDALSKQQNEYLGPKTVIMSTFKKGLKYYKDMGFPVTDVNA